MKPIFFVRQVQACFLGIACIIGACQPQRQPIEEVPVQPSPLSRVTADTVINRAPVPEVEAREVAEAEQALIDAGLVDIQTLDSTIRVDLKYSTTDNFVGVDIYGDLTKAYLQKEPARKLVRAQRYLREKHPGYCLLIYDAARSRRVQQILWDTLQKPVKLKPLYVADPQVGSIHNYGAAVDLTVTDPAGNPLDMGTGYDFFGEMAYPSKENVLLRQGKLTQEQIDNRLILREAMRRAGFTPIESEWWHFNALSLARCKQQYGIIE
jgi:D-alanyl-D-alanine dipeptidase